MHTRALLLVAFLLGPLAASAQVNPSVVATFPVQGAISRPLLHWKGGTGVLAITFADSLRLESTTLRSRGLRDVALVCLNSDGSIRWMNHIGGPADDVAAAVHIGSAFFTVTLAAGGGTGTPSTVRVNSTTLATNGDYDVALVGFSLNGRLAWFRVDGGPFPDVPTGMVVDEENGIAVAVTYVRQTRFESTVLADTMGETSVALIHYSAQGAFEAASSTTARSLGSFAATTSSIWQSGNEVQMLVTSLGNVIWNAATLSSQEILPTVVGLPWRSNDARIVASPSDCVPESLVCAPLGDAIVAASFESLPCEADILPSLTLRLHRGGATELIQSYHSSTGSATLSRAVSSPFDVVITGSFRGRLVAANGAVLDARNESNLAGFLVSVRGLTSVIRGQHSAEFTSAVFDGTHLYASAEVNGLGTVDGVPVGVPRSSSIVVLRYDVPSTLVQRGEKNDTGWENAGGAWTLWNMQGQVVATGSGERMPNGLAAGVYALGAPLSKPRLVLMP